MAGSRATSAREPGQVRKEAALSDPRWAMRGRPCRSRGQRSARGTGFEGGCTVRFSDPAELPDEDEVMDITDEAADQLDGASGDES